MQALFHRDRIPAPIIRVPLKRDKAPRLEIVDDIGAGCDGDQIKPAFSEIDAVPLGLFQDRAQTGQHDQFAVFHVKGQTHGTGGDLFDLFDLFPKAAIAAMALGAQRFKRPDHVFGRHRAAVGKFGRRVQHILHPFAVWSGFHRLRQLAVFSEWFVQGPHHQAFADQKPQLPRHVTLQHIGVQAVEAADLCRDDPPAGGGVRIGIGHGGEIRGQGGFAIHRDAVGGLCASHASCSNYQSRQPGAAR